MRLILPTWFEHLEESFSHEEFEFKKRFLPMKTSCPPAKIKNETPGTSCNIFVGKMRRGWGQKIHNTQEPFEGGIPFGVENIILSFKLTSILLSIL